MGTRVSPRSPADLIDDLQAETNIDIGVAKPPANITALAPSASFPIVSNISTPKEFKLSPEEAKLAFIHYVTQHRCWNKTAAREMEVESIEECSVFHYCLETFTETRHLNWRFEPYYFGQHFTSETEDVPRAWDIAVKPPVLFEYNTVKLELPSSAAKKLCPKCVAVGSVRCQICKGYGKVECNFCYGSGLSDDGSICKNCKGNGREGCLDCEGFGRQYCTTCDKRRFLKYFIEMTITWENHKDDYSEIPEPVPKRLVDLKNQTWVHVEEYSKVLPVNNYTEAVYTASAKLIKQHFVNYKNSRIIRQRHKLRIVPVFKVRYTWKNKRNSFFVYGYEGKVHTTSYLKSNCVKQMCEIL